MTRTLVEVARAEMMRLAEPLAANPGVCVYCGMPGTTRDHIAARALNGEAGPTVPACRRCNCVLQSLPSASVPERARFIAGYERAKNRRLLRMPEWTDAEIARFGRNIRVDLLRRVAARDVLRARLRNLEAGGIGNADFTIIEQDDSEVAA